MTRRLRLVDYEYCYEALVRDDIFTMQDVNGASIGGVKEVVAVCVVVVSLGVPSPCKCRVVWTNGEL